MSIRKFSPPNRTDSGVHRLHIWLATAELYGGDAQTSTKIFEQLIAAQPENIEVRASYAEFCWLTRSDCAQAGIDFVTKSFPELRLTTHGYTAATLQSYLWRQDGKDEQAQPLIDSTLAANNKSIESGDSSFQPAYENAALSQINDDRDGALTWLERAVDAGFTDPYAMALDPILAPLAGEPRFKALQARLHEQMRDMRSRVDFSDVDRLIAASNPMAKLD
ncbi:MAG: hypothetical protein IPK97_04400 [Ahniella sp.]|nr:hypothetical protein [Ahniella sp.]